METITTISKTQENAMENELQTLNQRIAERIGKELVDLIPDDQWQALVDAEIAKFKRDTAPKIIQELMRDVYMTKAKVTIDKLTSSSGWDSMAQQQINDELEKFIGKSAGVIFAAMLSPSMTMILQDLRNRIGY